MTRFIPIATIAIIGGAVVFMSYANANAEREEARAYAERERHEAREREERRRHAAEERERHEHGERDHDHEEYDRHHEEHFDRLVEHVTDRVMHHLQDEFEEGDHDQHHEIAPHTVRITFALKEGDQVGETFSVTTRLGHYRLVVNRRQAEGHLGFNIHGEVFMVGDDLAIMRYEGEVEHSTEEGDAEIGLEGSTHISLDRSMDLVSIGNRRLTAEFEIID